MGAPATESFRALEALANGCPQLGGCSSGESEESEDEQERDGAEPRAFWEEEEQQQHDASPCGRPRASTAPVSGSTPQPSQICRAKSTGQSPQIRRAISTDFIEADD